VFQRFTYMHKIDVDLLSRDKERFFDWHESYDRPDSRETSHNIHRLMRHLNIHSTP
jgi:hypothetical protein